MPVELKVDTAAAKAMLDTAKRQLPYVTSLAINDLAFQVQRAENANIATVFAHPRPFTAKSIQVDKADKATLTATVRVRPEVAKYLEPYEYGGIHVLPGRALLDPVDIKLDAYGQLPYRAMQRLRARTDIYIGPIKTRSGTINGVWQRLSVTRKGTGRRHRLHGGAAYTPQHGALKLLIRFGDALPVNKHLGFHARALAVIAANATRAFAAAWVRAMGSAR